MKDELIEEEECEENDHIMVDVGSKNSSWEPGDILSTSDEQMEDHDGMDIDMISDQLKSQWMDEVPSKIALVDEVGKIGLQLMKQDPGGVMEVGEMADSVGCVQEPGEITEDAVVRDGQSDQEPVEAGGKVSCERTDKKDGGLDVGSHATKVTDSIPTGNLSDRGSRVMEVQMENGDSGKEGDNAEGEEGNEDDDDDEGGTDDSDTGNHKDGADGSPAVGSKRKRKNLRISNACYRKRNSHAKPSDNSVIVPCSIDVGYIATVGHLYVAILRHHLC